MGDDDQPAGTSDDVAATVAGVDFFAATRDRPIRPDLPFLRNWSHTKSHAVQLGIGFGVFAYFAARWGEVGALIGVSVLVIEAIVGKRQQKAESSTCDHTVGFHDVVEKPHYFVTAFLLVVGAFVGITGTP